MHRRTSRRGEIAASLDDGCEMIRGGAAASADDVHAEFGDESGVMFCELIRSEVVVHMPIHDARETGVGDAGDRHPGMRREVTQMLSHFDRPGGAVDADDIGSQRIDGGERSCDLGTRQHATGEFHGDLHLEGDLDTDRAHRPAGAVHRRLHGEQIEHGLDDDQVDTAGEQTMALLLVVITELCIADLPERRELRAGTDGTGHPAGTFGGGVARSHLFGESGCGHIQFMGPLGDAVLTEGNGECAERIGLDDLTADLEVGGVEFADDVRSGDGQQFVAALEIIATEVLGGEAAQLDAGSHAAVEDDDTFAGCIEKAAHGNSLERGSQWCCGEDGRCRARVRGHDHDIVNSQHLELMRRSECGWIRDSSWNSYRSLGRSCPTHQDSSDSKIVSEALPGSDRRWEGCRSRDLGSHP